MPTRFLLAATLGLFAAACLGGCIPHSQVDASPVVGQVLDRATRQPIVGAQVALTTLANAQARTQTDGDGRFHLAGFRRLELRPLPYSMFEAPSGRLHVEAAGYQAYERGEFFGRDGPPPGYGNGIGSVQHLQILLARVGSSHQSSDSSEPQ